MFALFIFVLGLAPLSMAYVPVRSTDPGRIDGYIVAVMGQLFGVSSYVGFCAEDDRPVVVGGERSDSGRRSPNDGLVSLNIKPLSDTEFELQYDRRRVPKNWLPGEPLPPAGLPGRITARRLLRLVNGRHERMTIPEVPSEDTRPRQYPIMVADLEMVLPTGSLIVGRIQGGARLDYARIIVDLEALVDGAIPAPPNRSRLDIIANPYGSGGYEIYRRWSDDPEPGWSHLESCWLRGVRP